MKIYILNNLHSTASTENSKIYVKKIVEIKSPTLFMVIGLIV